VSDRITIRIDKRMREIIDGIAMAERKNASQIVREALYDYLIKFSDAQGRDPAQAIL